MHRIFIESDTEDEKKFSKSKFVQHVHLLAWKSYLQRQRRWPILVGEIIFASALFVAALLSSKKIFLTPFQTSSTPGLSVSDILNTLQGNTELGYAPNISPFNEIMTKAVKILQYKEIFTADTEAELNMQLYNRSQGKIRPVVWVIWQPKEGNVWKYRIRSTESARYMMQGAEVHDQHLRSGFLAVQVAVSQAIIEFTAKKSPLYEVRLVSMPVSPLMEENLVRRAISLMLLCFTVAFLPPVIETEILVVKETNNYFKRALRLRDVEFSSIYLGWMLYGYMTALPVCLVGGVVLIFVFRWIHVFNALVILFGYSAVMIMMSMVMSMFHNQAKFAAIWSILLTLLQTFLATVLVRYSIDETHEYIFYTLIIILPPLGLVHAFEHFALLQTGRDSTVKSTEISPVLLIFLSWMCMLLLYFGLLMMLQRTIGRHRAIGGQVSWKSIIFKKTENVNDLHYIPTMSQKNLDKLQEVDELAAKAIIFRNVSKTLMGVPILDDVSFNIYRGEFTIVFADHIQQQMIYTIEDLLTGLTLPEKGTINILGTDMKSGVNLMARSQMMGYCHTSKFLIPELTVQEHLTLFIELCLWKESMRTTTEYTQIRSFYLLQECDLETVANARVKNLHVHYRAQLCWAIALLMEPRVYFVIVISALSDDPAYHAVIKDKILRYREHITIVKLHFSSIHLADRVFVFDNKVLVFGGTPGYMFFRYGREYRVRVSFKSGDSLDDENISELLERAAEAGASVRAHFGSLLILRLPTSPTNLIAAFIKDMTVNATKYEITSMNISLSDSDEVCRRAIHDSRPTESQQYFSQSLSREALRQISVSPQWERSQSQCKLRNVGWKVFTFYVRYRIFLIIALLAAIIFGVVLGLSLTITLRDMEHEETLIKPELLTIEATKYRIILVLRVDTDSVGAVSIANGYVMSNTRATAKEKSRISYTAVPNKTSLTEYLITRAIDSPQQYVYIYAYGMDVVTNGDVHYIQILYSPLHYDNSAVARSLARAYIALLRYYSENMDASIEVTNDPLILDMIPEVAAAADPPLLVQFLLILTISHITLLPSKEYGLVRHVQAHASSFSPLRYWMSLYFCDILVYWALVGVMFGVMIVIMLLTISSRYFYYTDVFIVPFMLIVYGLCCVPFAYLFSLGPRVSLNSMLFMMANIAFSETSSVSALFYGEMRNYTAKFISVSPQFLVTVALMKIKEMFIYNSECILYKSKDLCNSSLIHRCCEKCGVMQPCYSRRSYMSEESGIVPELVTMALTGTFFLILLLLWEYKIVQQLWTTMWSRWIYPSDADVTYGPETPGTTKEVKNVLDKKAQLKTKRLAGQKTDNFGDCLLVENLSLIQNGEYLLRNIYLGIGKSEALALSGLDSRGRKKLCEILAGFRIPSEGHIWCMSKWKIKGYQHLYARQISLSCDRSPVPKWMTVRDALELIAILRGVPAARVRQEIWNYLTALEFENEANTVISYLKPDFRKRLHFAAAVIGAPPVVILDECAAYQKYSVCRAMYFILYQLRKRGHAVLIGSSNVESHMPITNRLAVLVDGQIYDIDQVDNLLGRYSNQGFTVVVHLKDEVDIVAMFKGYFRKFIINDMTEVLVNIQVLDKELDWALIFEKMELVKAQNMQVYSYVVCAVPIDYIYNTMVAAEAGRKSVGEPWFFKFFLKKKNLISPSKEKLESLRKIENKYGITTLKELPWSAIFQR